ncbi:MAG: aspartate aminotransferase family protein [Deltaproteobacteria bacterium]|nr:aspartate aminotransferase family protein [Deltaproteobacteria bacterium]
MAGMYERICSEYEAFSPRSREAAVAARDVFPGGDTRSSAHFAPYPLFVERAAGACLYDADGHRLLDFMNNFTSLIHGHAQPDVVLAVKEQIARGSAYAAPTASQVLLAQHLRDRVPGVEQLRFCSSGSEATLMAIRCARAATGRQKIMKMEGGYHGSYEMAEVSLAPMAELAGDLAAPNPVPIDDSFPSSVLTDTVVCPYNEPELARQLIARHAQDLAAVIVEPALGSMGMVPATREFLATLREATLSRDILLIFDEVITLRLGDLGAQQLYGITPDLTAMGKVIGGGLPIGAIGGRKELMQRFHPDQPRPVMHASTFSGNPMSMAAGLAAMQRFTPQQRTHIDGLGERLRDGFNKVFRDAGIRGQAIGIGSLSNIHLTDEAIGNARVSLAASRRAGRVLRCIHLGMLMRGVVSAARLMYCASTAMNDADIAAAVAALRETLLDLRDDLRREKPELLY